MVCVLVKCGGVGICVWERGAGCWLPVPHRDGGRGVVKAENGQIGLWYESYRFETLQLKKKDDTVVALEARGGLHDAHFVYEMNSTHNLILLRYITISRPTYSVQLVSSSEKCAEHLYKLSFSGTLEMILLLSSLFLLQWSLGITFQGLTLVPTVVTNFTHITYLLHLSVDF